jgi:mono/diheme cytochrome c family protein
MTLTGRGFALTFTKPMNRALLEKPESYELNRFRFYYHAKYGSPLIDEARAAVTEVRVAADGRSAELVLSELKAGFVYELSVPALRSADGEPIANPLGYYTANRLLNGEIATGGTTRLPRPKEIAAATNEVVIDAEGPTPAMIANGEKIYRLYCVACHQPNGRGIAGGAANFVDDKSRLAKSDAQLLEVITKGSEAKGMPQFKEILNPGQRQAVLAYIRASFGDKASHDVAK